MAWPTALNFNDIEAHIGQIFPDTHAMRVVSLANATLGIFSSNALSVVDIGKGLARARGLVDKHAIKQVDRLLSNEAIDVEASFKFWVPHAVGDRKGIEVAMDWTDFDADNHSTIMLSLITSPGQRTPLVWLTVDKRILKHNRNQYEYQVLVWLADALPPDVKVLIVADRGFGDQKLYEVLSKELMFDYLIRFRDNILVTAADGEAKKASEWVSIGGRARVLRDAAVTADQYQIGTVLIAHAKGMKDAWALATNRTGDAAKALLQAYSRRWSIECGFRDNKCPRFGMGMAQIRMSSTERRDRLWLLSALATELLTLLGVAGETLGYDRHLKTNTSKRRAHSLINQGRRYYELLPTMPQKRLIPLLKKFGEIVLERPMFANIYGLI